MAMCEPPQTKHITQYKIFGGIFNFVVKFSMNNRLLRCGRIVFYYSVENKKCLFNCNICVF